MTRRVLFNRARIVCVFLAGLAGLACSGKGAPKLYPVHGQVLYLGKPTPGAQVVFHPVGGGPDALRPSGVVGEDGSFTLKTYPYGDGAPQGDYQVAVVWPDAARQKDGNVSNRLPDKYVRPTSSGLQATVDGGPTELPVFQLK